ncbi:MAG: cytochrome c-type biogenesis protein CcmH [Pseudomonadales bacterium]|nr:cytochrome c-type biogenesis protein CcmH [Pseudomonadales bacterium]
MELMLRLASLATVLWLATWGLSVPPTYAASPVDVFTFNSIEEEARYRRLIAEIRCPKCMNTNIAGSDATSAQTLRVAVHRLIVQEGKTDQEVLDFMQDRYGDFVLYDPPLSSKTWFIWLLPVGVALVIIGFIFRLLRKTQDLAPPELDLKGLDPATQARLRDIIQD